MISDTKVSYAVLDNALKVQPAGLLVRTTIMWSLQPQWGGSYDLMQAFATDAQKYVSVNPSLKVLLGYVDMSKADYLLNTLQYESALEYANKAAVYGPRSRIQFVRTVSLGGMGKVEEALKACERGLDIWWQDLDLLDLKAYALRQLGRGQEARKVEARARELRSHVASSRSLTRIYGDTLSTHDTTGLRVAMAQPIDSSHVVPTPGSDSALERAFELLRARAYERAVREFDSAAVASPEDATVFYGRGTALIYLNKLDDATKDLERSIELDGKNSRAYFNLGWIYLHVGMYEKGVQLNAEAISRSPSLGIAYMNRSFGLRMLGKLVESGTDLARACQLGVKEACTLMQPAEESE